MDSDGERHLGRVEDTDHRGRDDGYSLWTRRDILKVGGLLAASPFLGACAGGLRDESSSDGEEVVLLGLMEPFTGAYAASGAAERDGAKLAADEINEAGGILGREIKIVSRDTATEPDVGARGVRELIQQENVDIVVGGVSSAVGLAMSEACFQLGVPIVLSGTHDDAITGSAANKTTFRFTTQSTMVARAVAPVIAEKGGNKWFFITADYAYGIGAEKAMESELEKLGGSVVGAEHTPLGATDFSAQLTKARGSGADALVLVLYGADLITATKQFYEFGLDDQLYLGGHLNGLEMAVGIGPGLTGVYGGPWNGDIDVAASQDFFKKIQERTGEAANWRHYTGYMAAREALQGIDRAGTTAAADVVAALEGAEFDSFKDEQAFWRDWDHQAMHGPVVFEGIPEDEWEYENQYFRTLAVANAEEVAPTQEENAEGAERIAEQTIPERPNYTPKAA